MLKFENKLKQCYIRLITLIPLAYRRILFYNSRVSVTYFLKKYNKFIKLIEVDIHSGALQTSKVIFLVNLIDGMILEYIHCYLLEYHQIWQV